MNAPQLPAYLQNRRSQGVAQRATAGMGSVLPPHISIRGNQFTLIDAAGNEKPMGPWLQCCIADVSDHNCKRYYENEWMPNSNEPPTCFSMNGVAPSREAIAPQASTCAQCQWNVRGSDTSRISGKPIKACRDEKMAALILPQIPGMMFQLVIPPGSFKNWSQYMLPYQRGSIDVSMVFTVIGFEAGVNGVMTFQTMKDQAGNGVYIDEATARAVDKALETKSTDVLVGRTDVPIAALPTPERPVGVNPALTAPYGAAQLPNQKLNAVAAPQPAFGVAPQATVPFGAGAVPTAMNPSIGAATPLNSGGPAPNASTTSPSEQPARRRRRTREEIAADNAAKAAAQPGTPPQNPPQPAVQPPLQAPFSHPGQGGFGQPAQSAFGTPAGAPPNSGFGAPAAQQSAAQFGIADPAQPDPQLAAMLASLNTGQ